MGSPAVEPPAHQPRSLASPARDTHGGAPAAGPLARLHAFAPLADARQGACGIQLRYLVLDVFTSSPLAGNQLAFFTDARALTAEQMQRLARELNLSESVFALEPREGGDIWIRIFTPLREVPFAGHPTLGSALVVARALARTRVRLETAGGLVEVDFDEGGLREGVGWMRQPTPRWQGYERAPELLRALGLADSALPVEVYDNGLQHVFVALAHPDALATLRPDLRALEALGQVCFNCFAGAAQRYESRMFAPAFGVAEDPATGSAAGPLAVHLSRHGRIAFGSEIEIAQGIRIGRPSLLRARARGSEQQLEAVEVGGAALILADCSLLL